MAVYSLGFIVAFIDISMVKAACTHFSKVFMSPLLCLSLYLAHSRKHTHTLLSAAPFHPTLLSLSQNHIFIKVSQPWLSTHSNNVIRTKVREKVGDSMLPNKLSCNHRASVKLMCKPVMNASCQRKVAVEGSQGLREGVGQPAVRVSWCQPCSRSCQSPLTAY